MTTKFPSNPFATSDEMCQEIKEYFKAMARKTVSEQDRALAFIKTATREQLDSFIQTATLVRDVKWPAVASAPRTTRTVKAKEPIEVQIYTTGAGTSTQ